MPGIRKFNEVTLKRGVTDGENFFKWIETVRDGAVDRRQVTALFAGEGGTGKSMAAEVIALELQCDR